MSSIKIGVKETGEEYHGTDTEYGYGSFTGGDPRDFYPDPECSTPEERAAHGKACIAFSAADNAGKPLPLLPCPHQWIDGAHVNIQPFGLGVQKYRSMGLIYSNNESNFIFRQ